MTPPPPVPNCLQLGLQASSLCWLLTKRVSLKSLQVGGLLQTTVPPAAGKHQWSAPGHPATALSPAGFNEVKCSQDSSTGTASVISYLWRCELCLYYCLYTFLFWCPVTRCAHWKKENYNYTHKSLWELQALLKPVFSSVLQCFLGSMKVFYFLLLLQHTDEMFSMFCCCCLFCFLLFPLQLLHTRKCFPIFLLSKHTNQSAFDYVYWELFDHIPYFHCPQ